MHISNISAIPVSVALPCLEDVTTNTTAAATVAIASLRLQETTALYENFNQSYADRIKKTNKNSPKEFQIFTHKTLESTDDLCLKEQKIPRPIFISFSFDFKRNKTAASNEHTLENSIEEKTFRNYDVSLLNLFLYNVDKMTHNFNEKLKIKVYPSDSHSNVTNDGIKCELFNISMIGTSMDCSESIRNLISNEIFINPFDRHVPVPLNIWNSKELELKVLCDQLISKYDIDMKLIEPSIQLEISTFTDPTVRISGKPRYVELALFELSVELDKMNGKSVEFIELAHPKQMTAIYGPKKKFLLEIILQFGVGIYSNFEGYIFDINYRPLLKDNSNCAILAVTCADVKKLKEAVNFIKENLALVSNPSLSFHNTSKASSDVVNTSSLAAKSHLMTLFNTKPMIIQSRTFRCSLQKFQSLLLYDQAALQSIALTYGVIIQYSFTTPTIDVTIYGTHLFLIEKSLQEICDLIYRYETCIVHLIDSPKNLNFKMESFDEFESLPAKLRLISQRTNTSITVEEERIILLGKEEELKVALSYVKKLSIVKNHSIGFTYELERSPEIKEFICGKKDGKINKIIKETGGIKIEMINSSENFLTINLQAASLVQIENGLELLNGEFPAEISFFVPEIHHKRIIGHGGKNIQRIMKKFGVYIKFLNFEECIAKHGHPTVTFFNQNTKYFPNVIVKTPFKNREVLNEMKIEVLSEADEIEVKIMHESFHLPLGLHSLTCDSFGVNFKRFCTSYGFDYFLIDNENLMIFGSNELKLKSAMSEGQKIVPKNFLSFDPNSVDFGFFRLEKSSCFGLTEKSTNFVLSSVPVQVLTSSRRSDSIFDFCIDQDHSLKSNDSLIGFSCNSSTMNDAMVSEERSSICSLLPLVVCGLDDGTESIELSTFNLSVDQAVGLSDIKPPPGLIGPKKHSKSSSSSPSSNWWNLNFLDFNFKEKIEKNSFEKKSTQTFNQSMSSSSPFNSFINFFQPKIFNEGIVSKNLEEFLTSLGLCKYLNQFKLHEIELGTLPSLSDEDLKEIGIHALGPRKKILNAVQSIISTACNQPFTEYTDAIFNDQVEPESYSKSVDHHDKEIFSCLSEFENIFNGDAAGVEYFGEKSKFSKINFFNCPEFQSINSKIF